MYVFSIRFFQFTRTIRAFQSSDFTACCSSQTVYRVFADYMLTGEHHCRIFSGDLLTLDGASKDRVVVEFGWKIDFNRCKTFGKAKMLKL